MEPLNSDWIKHFVDACKVGFKLWHDRLLEVLHRMGYAGVNDDDKCVFKLKNYFKKLLLKCTEKTSAPIWS